MIDEEAKPSSKWEPIPLVKSLVVLRPLGCDRVFGRLKDQWAVAQPTSAALF
jgi:hypothetical protein